MRNTCHGLLQLSSGGMTGARTLKHTHTLRPRHTRLLAAARAVRALECDGWSLRGGVLLVPLAPPPTACNNRNRTGTEHETSCCRENNSCHENWKKKKIPGKLFYEFNSRVGQGRG